MEVKREEKSVLKIVRHFATIVIKVLQIPRTETDAGTHLNGPKAKMEINGAEVDVTKFDHVITNVLIKLNAKKSQWEDLRQECYVALLEKLTKDDDNWAAVVCKSRIIDIWESQGRKIKTDSLDDPKILHGALKVSVQEEGITEQQLLDSIKTLPDRASKIVRSVYVGGKKRSEVAKEFGVTPQRVSQILSSSVKKLRKHFAEVV